MLVSVEGISLEVEAGVREEEGLLSEGVSCSHATNEKAVMEARKVTKTFFAINIVQQSNIDFTLGQQQKCIHSL